MGSHWMEAFLAAGVLVPLVSFTFLVFFGVRLGKPLAGWFATAAIGTSCVLSSIVLFNWMGLSAAERAANGQDVFRFVWSYLGTVPIEVGVKLDSLTVIMYFMVTFIATWIHVFSVGYMAGHSDEVDGQSKFHRFFCYLSLFCFSMLGLVISSSLLFLFIFWELVGLCSYLLIGFYFDKKYASDAAIKAFVTNRVGDFGFLFGLMMVFFYLKTLDLDQAAANLAAQWAATQSGNPTGVFAAQVNLLGWHIGGMMLATMMGIGLFCGAMGKSAQFPLHVWLPDAMAGPTPVSALIHAATMVAAGVYLVARVFRLLTPDAQMFIAVIGCITLTITALIAIVQTDIKKVLAYSTLSQLGYMIFGMGVGAWIGALFHLMTHAFFKAMLFLGSGQVIEGCHHEQDMRKMGGLRSKMPVTCWTFFIGVLAIAGFGIPGVEIAGKGLGLGGFFSKDEILVAAYHRTFLWDQPVEHHAEVGQPSDVLSQNQASEWNIRLASDGQPTGNGHSQIDNGHGEARPGETAHVAEGHADTAHGAAGHVDQADRAVVAGHVAALPKWLFYLPLFIAYVTPFYMMRAWWLTFMGKPRDHHVHDHAHESPLMFVPLVVLAVGTLFCSYFVFRDLIGDAAVQATQTPFIVGMDPHAHEPGHAQGYYIGHEAHQAMIPLVGGAFIVGFAIAIFIYRNGLGLASRLARLPGANLIHLALSQKLFFDHLYNAVLVEGTKRVVAQLARIIDTYVIDLVANLLAKITERLSVFTGRVVDAHGVDGVVNGAAESAWDLGKALARPQTGLIRNYVLYAAAGVGIIVLCVVFSDQIAGVRDAVAARLLTNG